MAGVVEEEGEAAAAQAAAAAPSVSGIDVFGGSPFRRLKAGMPAESDPIIAPAPVAGAFPCLGLVAETPGFGVRGGSSGGGFGSPRVRLPVGRSEGVEELRASSDRRLRLFEAEQEAWWRDEEARKHAETAAWRDEQRIREEQQRAARKAAASENASARRPFMAPVAGSGVRVEAPPAAGSVQEPQPEPEDEYEWWGVAATVAAGVAVIALLVVGRR